MDTWRPRKVQRNKYQLLFNKVTSILFPIPKAIKPRANGRNIVDQQLPTLLDVTSFVRLHTLLQVVGFCCAKFETGQTFQPTTPNISFVPWSPKRSATMLDPFDPTLLCYASNIVGATDAHYAWFAKTYGLYPSHDTLQVPTLSGVVASVCIPLPTRTQQLPTLLCQQCWELLRPFARSLREKGTSFQCKDFWIVWVDKSYLWLVNSCLEYHRPNIISTCPPKRSLKSLFPTLVPVLLKGSEVKNSTR